MKRLFSALAAGAILLGALSACAGEKTAESASNTAQTAVNVELNDHTEWESVLSASEKESLPAVSGMTCAGNALYGTDSYHRTIWKWEDGVYEVIAGNTDVTDVSGRPVGGYNDADFASAAFSEPWAIVPYKEGFLVSDAGNNVIRYLDMEAGRVYTALGTGETGSRNGAARYAAFDSPTGMAVSDDGTIYIADTGNHSIRSVNEEGVVTTYAGGEEGCALGSLDEARFSEPTGLCWANGTLYVADSGNHRVVAISGGTVTLVAGAEQTGDAAYEGGYLDGPAADACFASPQGVAVAQDGTVYIADTGNGAVRMLKNGEVTTILAMDEERTYPVSPRGILAEGESVYVGDVFSRILLCSAD